MNSGHRGVKVVTVRPETRYARSGDIHIAYQVTGQGRLDLVLVPGWISHLESDWEHPISFSGWDPFLGSSGSTNAGRDYPTACS